MTEPQQTSPSTVRHLIALAVGALAVIVAVEFPGGVLGYLGMIALGLTAVLICHAAIKRPGRFLWAAIIGLVLSYLELILAVGLLVVSVTRIFSSI